MQNNDSLFSYLNALAQSGQLGAMGYGSTIQKAANSIPGVTAGANFLSRPINAGLRAVGAPFQVSGMTPQDAQQGYDQNYQDTMNNPDVKAHPVVSTAGQIGGGLAMAAPIMALAPSAGVGIAADAVGAALPNAVAGALYNQPGQKTLLNPQGALIGGAVGAGGGIVQGMISKGLQQSIKTVSNAMGLEHGVVAPTVDNFTGMTNVNTLHSVAMATDPTSSNAQAINGLMQMINPYVKTFLKSGAVGAGGAGIGATIGGALDGYEGAKVGGGIGAGIGVGGPMIMAAPSVISKIVGGTMKPILTMANSLGDQLFDNPSIATNMLNRINTQFANAGVQLTLDKVGNITMRSVLPQDDKPEKSPVNNVPNIHQYKSGNALGQPLANSSAVPQVNLQVNPQVNNQQMIDQRLVNNLMRNSPPIDKAWLKANAGNMNNPGQINGVDNG